MLEEKLLQLDKKVTSLLGELRRAREENAALHAETDTLKPEAADAVKLRQEIEAQRKENEAQLQENEALRQKNAIQAQEYETQRQENDAQRQKIAELDQKVAEMDQKTAELEKEVGDRSEREQGFRERLRLIIDKIDALETNGEE